MFGSSMGFTVNAHYCEGNLKSFNLIGEAKSCHDKAKTCPRHKTEPTQIDKEKNNCCSNKTIIVDDLDEDFNFSIPSTIVKKHVQIQISEWSISIPISSVRNYISPFTNDQVRVSSRDIYVLLERFLI